MTTELHLNAGDDGNWASQACTLPTAERPLRVAEFDQLFTTALRGLRRQAPTRLLLTLDSAAETTARDLTARESNCCSFFGFTFTPDTDGHLMLEITVPPAQVDVLDALSVRAASAADGCGCGSCT